jgi:hypothetical protein
MSDRTHPRRQRKLSAGDVRELARIKGWEFTPMPATSSGTPPSRQEKPASTLVDPILPLGSA